MWTLKNVGNHPSLYGGGHYEVTGYDDGSIIITTILNTAGQTYTVKLTREEWERLAMYVKWFDLPDELRFQFGDTSMPQETRTIIINGWNKMDNEDKKALLDRLNKEKNVLKRVLIAVMDCTNILLS